MTIANSLFVPQLQKRKTDDDPITVALRKALQIRCDAILSAAPNRQFTYNDIQTDAEFAHIRTKGTTIIIHRIAAGMHLSYNGENLP